MISKLKKKYKLPKVDAIRLEGVCTDAINLIDCINHFGKSELQHIFRFSKSKEENIITEEEIFNHHDMTDSPYIKTFLQLLFNIELLYIKLYMVDEAIKKNKKIPSLQIEGLKEFRLAFTHHSTGVIFNKNLPSVQHIKWFKKDLSEICFTFLGFRRKSKDVVMTIEKDIQKFQKWEEEVFEYL